MRMIGDGPDAAEPEAVRSPGFAEVAVDAPAGHARTFSYSVPDGLDVRPGHLVRVPFGRRLLPGVVFSLTGLPEVPETRDIVDTTHPEPLLGEQQLALARWISRHYMSGLFEAAALMMPPGAPVRTRIYLAIDPSSAQPDQAAPETEKRVLAYVAARGEVGEARLLRALGERARHAVRRLADRGALVRSERSGPRPPAPRFRELAALPPDGRASAEEWLASNGGKAPRQAAFLARLMETGSTVALSEARKEFGASAVNALLKRGLVEKSRVPVYRDPLGGLSFPPAPPVTLTRRQLGVSRQIRAVMRHDSASPRSFLLEGVTGSGKTEIYLDAADACLEAGRTAIVMVPEIALTHQTVERFAARFPGRVALVHSRLTRGQQVDQWHRIRSGDFPIVIGSRGALFSPQPNLGLIVIDEEHEWTYKQQDASPRYHAREVAERLSALTGAVVLMGSASPDLVSHYRALRRDIRLLSLPDRVASRGAQVSEGVDAGRMARVSIVDMREELREGNRDTFSRPLRSELARCLSAGDQAILFLNRRGRSSFVQCRTCGAGLRCRRCDIALTYHRAESRLACHYCGYRRRPPSACPRCQSHRLSYYGVGTEAVAEEVARLFPDVGVLRWDRDSTSGPRAYEDMLNGFRRGDAQVLVGTQMIAKGLHFPSVTLVGVVSADIGLNIPDYRSGERTFQLLCQVAGRAGRGRSPGRVIIQTYQPDNYAIRAAAAQDYQLFYGEEVPFRREQSNPPFGRLIHLVHSHTNRAICERGAAALGEALAEQKEAWGHWDVEILGPTPAYPPRLRGRYRWHIVLRGDGPRALLDRVTVPTGWAVDVDPVALT